MTTLIAVNVAAMLLLAAGLAALVRWTLRLSEPSHDGDPPALRRIADEELARAA